MNLEKLHPKRRENHKKYIYIYIRHSQKKIYIYIYIYIFVDGKVAINNQNKWLDQYPIKEKKNTAQSDAQK